MLKRVLVTAEEYSCDRCGKDLGPADNALVFHDEAGNDFCLDCGLMQGIVEPMAWAKLHGLSIFHHVVYKDGKVVGFQKWGRGFHKYILEVRSEKNGVDQHG